MASLDLQQFLALSQTTPEFIWKGMERFVSRGEEDKLLRLIDALPAAWWSQGAHPARSPAAVAQSSFWARTIKRGMLEVAETVLSKYPDKDTERRRVAFASFAAIADARNDEATRFFFPAGETVAFASKHWEVAFKSKNNGLFDRINPNLDARRALNFVQNYFFDLQLNQLKRLSAFIPDTQWPLTFARDAIARFRGPGMISFFIDKGFKAQRINPTDVRACLLASVRADNGRAMHQILGQIQSSQMKIDWSAPIDLGDVMLRASEELRINAVKIPLSLRKSPLIEAAVLRGDSEIAQALIDAGSRLPSDARMQQWFDFVQQELKSTGVPAGEIRIALSQSQGCRDFLAMVSAADTTHSASPTQDAPAPVGRSTLPQAAELAGPATPDAQPHPDAPAEEPQAKTPRLRM